MSLSDEIERIKKEEADKKKRHQEQLQEKEKEEQRKCEEALNIFFSTFFSKHNKNVVQQNDFLINKIKALEIINILAELRQIANLVYDYRTEEIVKQIQTPTLFGSKLTNIKERIKIPIPAKIVVSRITEEKILKSSEITIDDIDSNWSAFFSDFHPSLSCYSLKNDFVEEGRPTVDKGFSHYLNKRLKEINELKGPLIEGFRVKISWDYEYYSYDSDFGGGYSETDDSLTISVNENVAIRTDLRNSKYPSPYGHKMENLSLSIPLIECTPQWIRKKIAEAHVKYNFH